MGLMSRLRQLGEGPTAPAPAKEEALRRYARKLREFATTTMPPAVLQKYADDVYAAGGNHKELKQLHLESYRKHGFRADTDLGDPPKKKRRR